MAKEQNSNDMNRNLSCTQWPLCVIQCEGKWRGMMDSWWTHETRELNSLRLVELGQGRFPLGTSMELLSLLLTKLSIWEMILLFFPHQEKTENGFFFENNDTPGQKTVEVCNDGQSMTVAWNVACLWRAFHEKAWPKWEILQFARHHFQDETLWKKSCEPWFLWNVDRAVFGLILLASLNTTCNSAPIHCDGFPLTESSTNCRSLAVSPLSKSYMCVLPSTVADWKSYHQILLW